MKSEKEKEQPRPYSNRFTNQYALEFIGSFIIVFTIHNSAASNSAFAPFSIALSFFIAVTVAAKVSGAHLNSAVTFLSFLNAYRRDRHNMDPVDKFYGYAFYQIAGGVAAGLFSLALGNDVVKLGIRPDQGYFNGFVLEAIYTCLLCLVVAVLTDPNYPPTEPALIGLLVAGVIYVQAVTIGSMTGGVVNPSIGIALTLTRAIRYGAKEFVISWIYIAAPLFGAVLAFFIYQMAIRPALTPAAPLKANEGDTKYLELREKLNVQSNIDPQVI